MSWRIASLVFHIAMATGDREVLAQSGQPKSLTAIPSPKTASTAELTHHAPPSLSPFSWSDFVRHLENTSKIFARLLPKNVSRRGFTEVKLSAKQINDTALQEKSFKAGMPLGSRL